MNNEINQKLQAHKQLTYEKQDEKRRKNDMDDKNNPESDGFFDIILRKRENCESLEEQWRKEERQKYNRAMRLARRRCPIKYDDFARLLKYLYNINYIGTKNLTNHYVDDLISVGKLKKDDNGIVMLGDVEK